MKKIVIVAGDKSGDIYGGLLCQKIKEKFLDAEIYSFGGTNLAQHSLQILDLTSYSVSGILEVFSSVIKIFNVFKKVVDEINNIKPDLIILIDFPDFNLRLAQTLDNKYHLFYYVSPQVWAWRKKRIESLKRYANKMVVIFKFEEDFYKKEGMNVLYFGHPLLEIIEKRNITPQKIISFMPGSRKNEIKMHLPVMIGAKKIIEKELPDYSFQIIRPENIEESFYKKIGRGVKIVNHSPDAIETSEFIITSSGTATVEIAIMEVPFLIIYRLKKLTWFILRFLVNVRFIGMVNILSGKRTVEELLQDDVKAEKIAEVTLSFMKDKTKYENLKAELKRTKELLEPKGATVKFAEYIGKYLGLLQFTPENQ
jgi:lipid-A-disaccharide synthase